MQGHNLTVAQISDLHCGHPMFEAELLDQAIEEINEMKPDLVVVAGDLTAEGYAPQYRQAKKYLDRPADLESIVIPGNHDLMKSSHRVRGYTRPSYNVIEVGEGRVRIVQRYPGLGEVVAASYSTEERRLSLNPQLAGMFDRGAWNV